MYKKKQFLAMCLAGLCSTTTVANVYNVTAMAATAASQAAETSAAASDAPSNGQTNPGGNPPSGVTGSSGDGSTSSGNPQDGKGNPPSDANGKPGDGQGPQGNPPDGQPGGGNGQPGTPPDGQGGPNTQSYDYSDTLSGKLTADGEEVSSDNETISTTSVDENAALVENGDQTDGRSASTTAEDKADASALESPANTQLVPSTEAAAETSTEQSTAPWAVAGVIIIAALAGITTYLRKRK